MIIETTFESLDHSFLISALEKYGFGKIFILRVKIRVLLTVVQVQISHVGQTPVKVTQFQPFILALEILFLLIKSKPEIEGMIIFDYNYLYPAYADNTTFFLKDIISVKHVVDTFYFFCTFQD